MDTIELTSNRPMKKDFARMKSVLACASGDSTRPAINRVLVEKVPAHIEMQALAHRDGHRFYG